LAVANPTAKDLSTFLAVTNRFASGAPTAVGTSDCSIRFGQAMASRTLAREAGNAGAACESRLTIHTIGTTRSSEVFL
jgi:hypothetical protein